MSLNTLHNRTTGEARTDIYTDINSLKSLKSSAREDAQGALPEVARQFEAVMISMMIKNLRKTGMEDPLFNSQAMDSYRDMYDQQLGMELSKGQGIGFAKAIVAQMQYQAGQQATDTTADTNSGAMNYGMPERRSFPDHYATPNNHPAANVSMQKEQLINANSAIRLKEAISPEFASPEQFVEKLWPLAEDTAQKLGVSAEMILSQAALETGWGKHIISNGKDSSYNLFNIKADQNWSGIRMDKVSAEFSADSEQMVAQKSQFRAYDSFQQSFTDYVDFISNSQRYNSFSNKLNGGLNKTEQSLHDIRYIKGIHKAGYATDPVYPEKILRVLKSDAIQNQIRLASK